MKRKWHIRALALLLTMSYLVMADAQEDTRKIGLLLLNKNCSTEIGEAQEVVRKANTRLSSREKAFELVIRTVEGPWGAGSKESVNLVYEDSVLLYLGALDGRNAHLAEQVAAKTHLVYIETRATEPTLSQAYVPWFVRVVPNDDQQAEVLVKCMSNTGGGKMAILSRNNADSHNATRSLVKAGGRKEGLCPVILEWDTDGMDSGTIIKKIKGMQPEHLVFTFWTEEIYRLSIELHMDCPEIRIYGNLDFASGLKTEHGFKDAPEGLILTSPFCYNDYLSDAISLAMKAIWTYSSDVASLKNGITGMKFKGGITGSVSFDKSGNREGPLLPIKLSDGIPVFFHIPY